MKLKQIIEQLKTMENPARKKTNQRLNIEMDNFGVPMTKLRPMAKTLGINHELGLELWESNQYEAMILGSMILDAKEIGIHQANQLIQKASHSSLVDELSLGVLRKSLDQQRLFELWNEDENPLIRRAAWDIAIGLILDDKYSNEQIDYLLRIIESRLVDAVEDEKWAMNRTLAEIGIHYPDYRPQVLALAEKLGVYRDMKVAKGCTSAYAPEWINAVVKRKQNND